MTKLSASFDAKFHYKILRRSDLPPTLSNTDLHGVVQEFENLYDYVFYEVGEDQEWRELCLERADRIFIVVNAHQKPELDAEVVAVLKSNDEQGNIKKILILLHEMWTPPTTTADWLLQMHFVGHHHLCIHQKDDFSRFLRFINGSAIGLVLGGGGTRAWAQMGTIRYLFEQNIPIDACAGTSAGAINAAVFINSRDFQDFKEASQIISRTLKFNEYTIPVASLLSSSSLTRALKEIFGIIKIEDLKTMLFCVAADLTSFSEIDIHQGLLWRAIRASAAIPGIYPPVYGDGRMLVDGAVVNNLPVDVMRKYLEGFGKIIAVDISEMKESLVEYNYPLDLHWRWVLQHKVLSRSSESKLPSIAGTLLKGLMLSSTQKSRLNIKLSDVYIKPVLSEYGFLDASNKEELIELGYVAAQKSLQDWRQLLDYCNE
jgi:predicted acylesterase/phospholipase RssA